MTRPVRTLLIWCPDWPVVAAEIESGVSARGPVAVLHGNRVVACSPAARAEGVRRGLRRREAQGRCPHLAVVDHDPGRDARTFEPVVAAIEQVVAGVEVVEPGSCAMAVRGAARYFGGEQPAAERVVERIAQEYGVEAQAGIAEGAFAAGQAARAGRVVPPGQTPRFLAGIDIRVLGRPELTDRLRRLGIRTLGEFAELPAGDVLTRFGFDAAVAHRLAGGTDERPLAVRRPPPELAVAEEFDEPVNRVDAAAFAARSLARRLHDTLAGQGLACTRLGIEAVTTDGRELHRSWRHDGLLTAAAITDRVRWQLEGWLTGGVARPLRDREPDRSGSGIRRLRLIPDGVLAQSSQQPGLWGDTGESRARADRALGRVQGLLGPASVLTAVLRGGRSPADQVRLVPWGEKREPPDPGPWPGQLPAPAPATVLVRPAPATVQDARGQPVTVGARLAVSAAPAWLGIADHPPARITGWTGPWPLHERWWAPGEARRRARFQVRLDDGRALLLVRAEGRWCVEAWYD